MKYYTLEEWKKMSDENKTIRLYNKPEDKVYSMIRQKGGCFKNINDVFDYFEYMKADPRKALDGVTLNYRFIDNGTRQIVQLGVVLP